MERQQRRFEGAIMVAKEGRDLKEQNTAVRKRKELLCCASVIKSSRRELGLLIVDWYYFFSNKGNLWVLERS